MVYIFEEGRILYTSELLTEADTGKYMEVEALPNIVPMEGMAGVITGCDLTTGTIKIEYLEIPEPESIREPQPTFEPPKLPLSEAEQTQLEAALNVEYLICLAELND